MSATQGPWETSVNAEGQWDVCAEDGGDMIADLSECPENAEANARLIAAAPDLLAALEWALPFVEKHENTFPGGSRQQLMEAKLAEVRAVLAKAGRR